MGVGRLQRHFGLTIDNLAAVELRDRRRTTSFAPARRRSRIFGLRGAGWNFGIATAFEFRLQPFKPDLHRGVLTFAATRARELWDIFREYAQRAGCGVDHLRFDRAGPDSGYADDMVGKPIAYFAWNHSGAIEDVERDTAALRRGPTPLTTTIGSSPYLEVQTAHDLAYQWGSRSFIKSHNANDVRLEALDELVELIGDGARAGDLSITALGGAIARVAEDASAYSGRAAAFDMSADANWSDPADDETVMDWCRQQMAVVEPDRTIGAYPNGNSDSGPEETRRFYGDAKLTRLSALKRIWDPDNVLHVNLNVAPAQSG